MVRIRGHEFTAFVHLKQYGKLETVAKMFYIVFNQFVRECKVGNKTYKDYRFEAFEVDGKTADIYARTPTSTCVSANKDYYTSVLGQTALGRKTPKFWIPPVEQCSDCVEKLRTHDTNC